MIPKYELVPDTETDSPQASIARHLRLIALVATILLVALCALVVVYNAAALRAGAPLRERQRAAVTFAEVMRMTHQPIHRTEAVGATQAYDRPGFRYTPIQNIAARQRLNLIARNASGNWYQLDNGLWVSVRFLHEPAPNLPVTTP